jgi:hypothetical protein
MHELEGVPNQRIRIDRELIRLFLAMSPEQRLATNDNVIRAIEELRDAFIATSNLNTYHPAFSIKGEEPHGDIPLPLREGPGEGVQTAKPDTNSLL